MLLYFRNIAYGQGASMALPIWGMYMKDCYANKDLEISKGEFEAPEELTIEVDCDNYNPDGSETPQVPDIDDLGM